MPSSGEYHRGVAVQRSAYAVCCDNCHVSLGVRQPYVFGHALVCTDRRHRRVRLCFDCDLKLYPTESGSNGH